MGKNILIQYCDMKEEIKDIRRRISRLEKQIAKIMKEGNVKDTVSGGMGGIQHFTVEGFPEPEYHRKKMLLRARKAKLEEMETELLELTNQAEEYINSIERSELRIMFRFYYLDDMTWIQVAHQMNRVFPNRVYTDESCRKKHDRFLEKVK